jgi:hypothetical protein
MKVLRSSPFLSAALLWQAFIFSCWVIGAGSPHALNSFVDDWSGANDSGEGFLAQSWALSLNRAS